MSKRYEIRYGRLYIFDVVKETPQQFVHTSVDAYTHRVRQSKAGTFPTLREALEDQAKNLDRQVSRLASDLDLARKSLAQHRDVLGRSDEKLEKAVDEILKLRR